MSWTYDQASGVLSDAAGPVATGYSGMGAGRNAPEMQDVPNLGPIPRGTYTIGPPYDTTTHGPYVLRLTPTEPLADGRSGFLMHGDNSTHTASEGCVIMPRSIREQVWESGDPELTVV